MWSQFAKADGVESGVRGKNDKNQNPPLLRLRYEEFSSTWVLMSFWAHFFNYVLLQ